MQQIHIEYALCVRHHIWVNAACTLTIKNTSILGGSKGINDVLVLKEVSTFFFSLSVV